MADIASISLVQASSAADRPMTAPRAAAIATLAFLTLVDLFAMQAVLPSLIARYGVSPAAMGVAVNASTFGMAVSSLATCFLSHRIDRRTGVAASLGLLSIPTALLAAAPDLMTFAALRVAQGVFMASAFTLALAHLGERHAGAASATAFAAYIAGNVASNFIGRLTSAALTDHYGLSQTFLAFAALNLVGAALALSQIGSGSGSEAGAGRPATAAIRAHLADPALRQCFAIGFLILFAFIGVFTYVNLVLVAPPLSLGPMELGFVYFVFAPSIPTTLAAGGVARRFGTRRALMASLLVAIGGLPLLLASELPLVLPGLILVAVGTFAAQAVATGVVGSAAMRDRGAASGLYLALYFSGGLVGSAVLGHVFERFGWIACVGAVGVALSVAAATAARLRPPTA